MCSAQIAIAIACCIYIYIYSDRYRLLEAVATAAMHVAIAIASGLAHRADFLLITTLVRFYVLYDRSCIDTLTYASTAHV